MRDTTVTPHFFGVTSELSRVLHYYTKFRLSGNGGNSFFFLRRMVPLGILAIGIITICTRGI
ncbi:protein of unknown function [Kyrpidia spormannii]|uniref:Uncharacterized protein n=1 Tax=Kyrpidia spormannii TaxID=2055160 RepID=A0A6F9EDM1_9BACL|nr:protein of unknown function [Kyrpidia spormannii]